MYDLLYDPRDPNRAYATTRLSGLWRSTDGGALWTPASSGLPGGAALRGLAVDPTPGGALYVGQTGTPGRLYTSARCRRQLVAAQRRPDFYHDPRLCCRSHQTQRSLRRRLGRRHLEDDRWRHYLDAVTRGAFLSRSPGHRPARSADDLRHRSHRADSVAVGRRRAALVAPLPCR